MHKNMNLLALRINSNSKLVRFIRFGASLLITTAVNIDNINPLNTLFQRILIRDWLLRDSGSVAFSS